MVLKYFFKRFLFIFAVSLAGLIPLFASCDVVIRLASVPFSFQILKLFWFMLPLVCLFAVPIASCLAVGMTVGTLFARNELLLFHYFGGARRKLELAVFLFSVVLALVLVPLVWSWAPGSYWRGKQFLIRAAQQQIENLPAKRFHNIASRCTIFFKGKGVGDDGNTRFQEILLMVREKDDKQYLVTARSGLLREGILILFNGTIYNNALKNHCIASFKTLEIAFEKMFFEATATDGVVSKPTKFMTLSELRRASERDDRAWQEMHKRFAQISWQFLLPILIFLSMMIFAQQKSNILLSVVLSGSFFLLSYISLNMAYFFLRRVWWAVTIFYSVPWVLVGLFYWRYKRKWG